MVNVLARISGFQTKKVRSLGKDRTFRTLTAVIVTAGTNRRDRYKWPPNMETGQTLIYAALL